MSSFGFNQGAQYLWPHLCTTCRENLQARFKTDSFWKSSKFTNRDKFGINSAKPIILHTFYLPSSVTSFYFSSSVTSFYFYFHFYSFYFYYSSVTSFYFYFHFYSFYFFSSVTSLVTSLLLKVDFNWYFHWYCVSVCNKWPQLHHQRWHHIDCIFFLRRSILIKTWWNIQLNWLPLIQQLLNDPSKATLSRPLLNNSELSSILSIVSSL